MNRHTKISIVGIFIIIMCAANFITSSWSVLGTLDFFITCFGIGYLVNKINEEKSNGN